MTPRKSIVNVIFPALSFDNFLFLYSVACARYIFSLIITCVECSFQKFVHFTKLLKYLDC